MRLLTSIACVTAALCICSQHASSQLILTEVQPVPAAGEPEWVELVNTSATSVSLRDWTLCDPRGCSVLPDVVIAPGRLCVLTRDSIALLEQRSIPRNVTVRSVALPSLNNTTDTLMLMRGTVLIDSMAYVVRTSDRGRSIERCGTERRGSVTWEQRWAVSTAVDSATCGGMNTAVLSEQDYRLRSVEATRERIFVVVANDGTLAGAQRRVSCTLDAEAFDTVIGPLRAGDVASWMLPDAVSRGTAAVGTRVLQLRMDGSDDRPENDTLRASFTLPPIAGTLMINEVLTQPRSGECDFIEVWNGTEHAVDLADWVIETARGTQYRCVPPLVIPAGAFGVLCANLSSPSMQNVEHRARTSPTMALTQERELVVLGTPEGLRVDSMWYDRDYHHPRVASRDGVSLEKLNVRMRSEQSAAWSSCAAIERATPGRANSIALSTGTNARIAVQPRVISTDRMNEASTARISWTLPYRQSRARIDIYDESGYVRRTLCNGCFIASEGSIAWDGLDAAGRRLEPGPYVLSILAVDADTADVVRGTCLIVVAE